MVLEVGAYEAKTNLSRLLERVEGGERITLTRHGRPVAMLEPVEKKRPPEEVIRELKEFRRGRRLGDTGVRALVEEGRRL
ncbi:MAG: type II toxin-antitoxin system prevent-host-death family antitoxin [Rubrobacteraceae bacterium]